LGHGYISGGDTLPFGQVLALMGTRAAVASFSFRPPATRRIGSFDDRIQGRLLDAPDAVGDRQGRRDRTAGNCALTRRDTNSAVRTRPIEPVLNETIVRTMGVPASKGLKHA
jgi:hypothetical protein